MRNLMTFLAVLFLAAGARAQAPAAPAPAPAPAKKAAAFKLDLAAGWGSVYAEESKTLSQDSQFAMVHADLLDYKWFGAKSGIAVEIQFGGRLNYTVWSLNRAVVPGTENRIYGGTDVKLLQGTKADNLSGNYDLRVVAGTELAKVGPGKLSLETYLLEENSKIRFAFLYHW